LATYRRILITGAAGKLGRQLRAGLKHCAETLRLTDIAPLDPPQDAEETVTCDLASFDAVSKAVAGSDAVVHFGAEIYEKPFQIILDTNIRGAFNVFEAARIHGVRRVVYASSIHAVGFYAREDVVGTDVPHRPDGLYGLSKCFAEDLARLYFDKYGIEAVCLRICSSVPEPVDRRMLGTWLSFRDCVQLVERSLLAPRVGFTVAYGISDNREVYVSNASAAHLGYQPRDSAEPFRDRIEATTSTDDARSPTVTFVGGAFVATHHFEE
jgi:uronate dehydrogenase